MKYFFIYGLFGFLRLVLHLMLTQFDKLSFGSKIRLIRRPLYIRGKRHILIDDSFTSGVGLRLDAFPLDGGVCLRIGSNVEINDYVHIGAIRSVTIGNNVLIGSKVFISDHNHGFYGIDGRHDHPNSIPNERELSCAPVLIEDNVWIGEFVSVLPGVTIGKGSVIGSMSVVSKSIPPNSIAVGSPARVIKQYDSILNKWQKCVV